MVFKSFTRNSKIILLLFLCFFGLSFFVPRETKSVICGGCHCGDCILWDSVRGYYVVPCCQWWECPNSCGDSIYDCSTEECHNCTSCTSGGCFTGETEVTVGESENLDNSEKSDTKQIKDLKPGEIVSSFNPETGEVSEGEVGEAQKLTREGYYILETESGKKIKVTGEHPFLAVKAENSQLPNSSPPAGEAGFQLVDKLRNFLSDTLTLQFINSFQNKFTEILD